MKITYCKSNHIENPLGFAMDTAVVSWIVCETASKAQKTAQIIVAKNQDMSDVLYDSGMDKNLDSLGTMLPITLAPYSRYYWTIHVWGDSGDEAISDANWFETGKRDCEWTAKWITPCWADTSIRPYMRKKFIVSDKIKCARIYATGMGIYELTLNGKRIGEEYFTPGCNAYDAWVQVHTFDITDLLNDGENAIGALLGDGWAKGRFGAFGKINTPYTDTFSLLAELRVTLENGNIMVINTDESWKCAPSPLIFDNIYDGEIYDATKEIKGWANITLDDSKWENVRLHTEMELGMTEDRLSLPVVVKETLKPIKLIHTEKDEWVLDMGQNIVGWLRINIHEPKGTQIKITHGEVLQDGCFYRDNLRTAKAEYTYISDGSLQAVEPHFTFYGFRYAKLEGFTKPINIDDFTGCVVYSDLDDVGNIETSDPLVNRLFKNAKWSQKDNFLDVPTDCPQRDERMGWTGDAQVFCRTASFNMDTYAFYTKFMHDLWEEQHMQGGMVGSVVPSFLKNKTDKSDFIAGGSSVWGDCATIIPWQLYLHYGDKTILESQYDSMKAWVDWNKREDESAGGTHLRTTGFHFGDWLALDGPIPGGTAGGTELTFIASAYYKYSAELVAKAATVLCRNEDAVYYQKLSDEIGYAIRSEYFSLNGRSLLLTQTAYILALQLDLVTDDLKPRIAKDLSERMKKDDYHLKTGFVGTPFLCRVLSQYGLSNIAYDVFFQEDYPSWLYEVNMGATTIWERWNSILPDTKISGTDMNSLNHYAYGSIVEWMYRHMCGITPLDDVPGFKKFELRPQLDRRLYCVNAKFNSPMGLIESGWQQKSDGTVIVKATIPFGTQAVIYLSDTVLENVKGVDGLSAVQNSSCVEIKLMPGNYCFRFMSTNVPKQHYSLDFSLLDLCSSPEAKQVLADMLPMLSLIPSDMAPDPNIPFEQAISQMNPLTLAQLKQTVDINAINERLRQISVCVRNNGMVLE